MPSVPPAIAIPPPQTVGHEAQVLVAVILLSCVAVGFLFLSLRNERVMERNNIEITRAADDAKAARDEARSIAVTHYNSTMEVVTQTRRDMVSATDEFRKDSNATRHIVLDAVVDLRREGQEDRNQAQKDRLETQTALASVQALVATLVTAVHDIKAAQQHQAQTTTAPLPV